MVRYRIAPEGDARGNAHKNSAAHSLPFVGKNVEHNKFEGRELIHPAHQAALNVVLKDVQVDESSIDS